MVATRSAISPLRSNFWSTTLTVNKKISSNVVLRHIDNVPRMFSTSSASGSHVMTFTTLKAKIRVYTSHELLVKTTANGWHKKICSCLSKTSEEFLVVKTEDHGPLQQNLARSVRNYGFLLSSSHTMVQYA